MAEWLAGWQGTDRPVVAFPQAILFAADHGVATEGVSAYPAAVTPAMVKAIRAHKATASVLATCSGVELRVVDVGVERPTENLRVRSALSDRRFVEAAVAGVAAVDEADADLLVFGEMGIGNTTAASAVSASLFGGPVADWVGAGTGVEGEALANKKRVVADAVQRVGKVDPIRTLQELGGSELVAIAAAVLRARQRRIPVVLDGFIATASVAPLAAAVPGALDHCLAGHCSGEPGHRMLLERLKLSPLLNLDLRLGEGSGALLAVPLIRMAAAAVMDVATFSEWGLS